MIQHFISYIADKNQPYIIFDIGSRDCAQSIEFYEHFPNARIYAFECNPNTLPICKQNIEKYTDRITLVEGAVCDYDGDITFYPINQSKTITTWKDGNPGASSLFKSNGKYTVEKYVQDEIKTNCHRLDSVIKKYDIPGVDIIWMDLQGAELLALKGMGEFLQDTKYIHTEISHREMYTGQVMFDELHNFIIGNNFSTKNKLSMTGWQEDVIYENNAFDIVIPVGPNDIGIVTKQIEYTKQNIIGYRNIYIICCNDSLHIDGCITVSENIFPFSLQTVADYHGTLERNGWYLQQLLKLYAGFVIPGILEKYLVIDSDTFFLKPTKFIENGKCAYNFGTEYHPPYFEHMYKLHPTFTKKYTNISGICHHMMFEKRYSKEIFDIVENVHNDTFYNVFLKNVTQVNGSGASEYEIYFNYMCHKHPDEIVIRPLQWKNTNTLEISGDFDYVSYHWYMR
jgi:FkbM family methyltransferase